MGWPREKGGAGERSEARTRQKNALSDILSLDKLSNIGYTHSWSLVGPMRPSGRRPGDLPERSRNVYENKGSGV